MGLWLGVGQWPNIRQENLKGANKILQAKYKNYENDENNLFSSTQHFWVCYRT
jgi:hypothetical protein